MHTFDDGALRQLLENTLEEAWLDYRTLRADVHKRHGPHGKRQDWHFAARQAVATAIDALWGAQTCLAAAHTQED